MELKPYPRYKDSGVEWIGEIPQLWEIRKLKHFSRLIAGSTPDSGNKDYWDGDIIWVTPADLSTQQKTIKESKRTITKEGYINSGTNFVNERAVILATRAPIGYPTIVGTKLCFNQGCKAFEIERDFFPDYIYYLLNAGIGVLISKGNVTTFGELSQYELSSFHVSMPSFQEQSSIAAFLDKKTTQIDEIIDKNRRLIELLNEKRTALINHIVTKGLDPDAKMRDSGIEWIGEIPEGWDVHKLKFIAEIVLGKMLKNENEGGCFLKPYLRAQNILWESVDISNINEMWFSNGEMIKFRLKRNDLLVSEGGEVGRTAIWLKEIDECYIQNSVHKVTMCRNYLPRYYLYLFETYGKKGYFDSIVNRVSIAHLTREKLKEINCISPPYNEQSAIVSFLDKKIAQIDEEIDLIGKKIEILEEYKRSLIHHVVTGKVDVRGIEA